MCRVPSGSITVHWVTVALFDRITLPMLLAKKCCDDQGKGQSCGYDHGKGQCRGYDQGKGQCRNHDQGKGQCRVNDHRPGEGTIKRDASSLMGLKG